MTTYADSGVNITTGNTASKKAYEHAVSTFSSRKGMIGAPVQEEDGYAGFLDMGDYFLVQSDDSTGSKIDLAFAIGKLDTLGYDLTAMVADDAVCTGAEPISISNTLDVPKINTEEIDQLMSGLAKACSEQKIIIPAGEIAEVPNAVKRGVWSATVIGIVEKNKIITPENIKEGDVIISLKSNVARSNGFSLIRKILSDKFGDNWIKKEWKSTINSSNENTNNSWGEIMLTPSIIYSNAILKLIGRFGEDRKINVKGIAHITGGGIPSKLGRVLKKSGKGAGLTNIWKPHEAIVDLIKLGNVTTEEAYKTFNMGNGMMLIVESNDVDKTIEILLNEGLKAKQSGIITNNSEISITCFDETELKISI